MVRAAARVTSRAASMRTAGISLNRLVLSEQQQHHHQHIGVLCSAMSTSTLGKSMGAASSQAASAAIPGEMSSGTRLEASGGGGAPGGASRSIGTKSKIGEKVAEEEIRPGARSQVSETTAAVVVVPYRQK